MGTGSLAEAVRNWSPDDDVRIETLRPWPALALAAVLDAAAPPTDEGDPVPPMWHWLYLLDHVAQGGLGPDGHPAEGGMLPPIPRRRRMFAGGRTRLLAPLRFGDVVERTTRVRNRNAKSGRSGELLFVTTESTLRVDGQVRVVEEQDIVYRSGDAQHRPTPAGNTDPVPHAAWSATLRTDPSLLFRFSALTFNAHRIHYDEAYTTGVEGFEGLVVHGPLMALALLQLLAAHGRPDRLVEFSFRARRPAFCGSAIALRGEPAPDRIELAAYGSGREPSLTATAILKPAADSDGQ